MEELFKLEASYEELVDWMLAHPQEVIKARQEFKETLLKKRCAYTEGATFQITLMPLFLKKSSIEKIRQTSEALDKILDRVINLYFTEEWVREYFPGKDIPEEWLKAKLGHSKPTVFSRFDTLFDGKKLKYIEFNTDNPGGKGWTDTYENIYKQFPLYKDFLGEFTSPTERKILSSLYQTTMKYFNESGRTEKPRVALINYKHVGFMGDEEIVRDYFIENGVEANLIDPRDFEYKDKTLWSNNVKFNIVIRSSRGTYFTRFPKEMKDFRNAILDDSIIMINSFTSCLGSEKSLLSLLSNPYSHPEVFSEEDIKLLQEYIPWTRRLDETVTMSKDGEEISLYEYLLKHKETHVLKPSSGAGGWKVVVGKKAEKGEWKDALDEAIGSPEWVAQEYIEIPQIELPVIKFNKVVLEKKFVNISPFICDGHLVGVLGRVSDAHVINVSAGGGIIPIFSLER